VARRSVRDAVGVVHIVYTMVLYTSTTLLVGGHGDMAVAGKFEEVQGIQIDRYRQSLRTNMSNIGKESSLNFWISS
jgi:hypothetical protein